MINYLVKFILVLALIAMAEAACDIIVNTAEINTVEQLQFVFEKNTTKNICFNLLQPKAEEHQYCLRIDYHFTQCIDGNYDFYLAYSGQSYHVEVPLTRKCKRLSLPENEQQSVRIAYKFTKGYKLSVTIGFQHLIDIYGPTIIVLLTLGVILPWYLYRQPHFQKSKKQ